MMRDEIRNAWPD